MLCLGEIIVNKLKNITASCNVKFVTKGLGILHKRLFAWEGIREREKIGKKKPDLFLRRVFPATASTSILETLIKFLSFIF